MPRNRVIYQSEAVSVGGTEIQRVQSCNYNFAIERTDVNQFGELGAIDRLILTEPTVSVDMSYYFGPSGNELALGLSLTANQHALTGIIASTSLGSVVAIHTTTGGAEGSNSATSAIAIGNCYLSSWSLEASVGGIATVSCAFQGQNINFGTTNVVDPTMSSSGTATTSNITPAVHTPAVSGDISAIRPGAITIALGGAGDLAPLGISEADMKIQSVTVTMGLNREPLRKLGSNYAFCREITFPITCTISVTAIVGDTVAATLSELVIAPISAGTGDAATYDCTVTIVPKAISGASFTGRTLSIKKAKLNSQNISSSIGANKTVVMEFGAQIGANSGLFIT